MLLLAGKHPALQQPVQVPLALKAKQYSSKTQPRSRTWPSSTSSTSCHASAAACAAASSDRPGWWGRGEASGLKRATAAGGAARRVPKSLQQSNSTYAAQHVVRCVVLPQIHWLSQLLVLCMHAVNEGLHGWQLSPAHSTCNGLCRPGWCGRGEASAAKMQ
jgi:hypothetical protein